MKKIYVNGEDWSVYAPPWQDYEAQPVKVSGNWGGYMLSGRYEEDTITEKWRITLPLRPLTDEEVAVVLQSLRSGKYATIRFYDPEAFFEREVECRYTRPRLVYRSGLAGGGRWFCDAVIFEER